MTNNDLTGTVPTELGALVKMTSSLYCMSSAISGSLPTEMGRLTEMLEKFNLAVSNLQGSLVRGS